MNVKNYTYKVEFQDRGAGHIHGTLWLQLDKIEKLIKAENLIDSGEELPFKGLTAAFKKQHLDESDRKALNNFIDEYTTVCTHEGTVGKELSRIAQEVNKHHHTKTCRKHDTTCRFKYPRYPSPYTIVVEPCEVISQEEKEALLAKNHIVLRKVRDVLEDEDLVDKIMKKYNKQAESKEEYITNREK